MRLVLIVRAAWCGAAALAATAAASAATLVPAREALRRPAPAVWPQADAGTIDLLTGATPLADALAIGLAPVNGAMPRPPGAAAPPAPAPAPDTEEWLRRNVAPLAAIASGPGDATFLEAAVEGRPRALWRGEAVGGWRLWDVRAGGRDAPVAARFRRVAGAAAEGDGTFVWIEGEAPATFPDRPRGPFVATLDGPFAEVPRDRVTRQAWRDDATGAWQVPAEEVRWWLAWGVDDVLARLDAEPTPAGLRLRADPPRGPLDDTRGLRAGDVVVEVGGTRVRTASAFADAFRSALDRAASGGEFVVRLERDGVARAERFVVPGRGRGAP